MRNYIEFVFVFQRVTCDIKKIVGQDREIWEWGLSDLFLQVVIHTHILKEEKLDKVENQNVVTSWPSFLKQSNVYKVAHKVTLLTLYFL